MSSMIFQKYMCIYNFFFSSCLMKWIGHISLFGILLPNHVYVKVKIQSLIWKCLKVILQPSVQHVVSRLSSCLPDLSFGISISQNNFPDLKHHRILFNFDPKSHSKVNNHLPQEKERDINWFPESSEAIHLDGFTFNDKMWKKASYYKHKALLFVV